MIHYKKRLLLTVALIPVIGLKAQTVYPDIVVKYPTKGNLVQYFPYSTVRVIDNRMDTTKIYTRETGIYSPRHVNFNEPAAAVIKKYIDSAVRDSKKGAGELTAEGLRHNYRYCTLNMDNGDILYNDK